MFPTHSVGICHCNLEYLAAKEPSCIAVKLSPAANMTNGVDKRRAIAGLLINGWVVLDVFRSERMQCSIILHVQSSYRWCQVSIVRNRHMFAKPHVFFYQRRSGSKHRIYCTWWQVMTRVSYISYTMRMFPSAVHDRHWRRANDSTIPLSWSGRMISGWVLANVWATLIRNFQNFQIFQIQSFMESQISNLKRSQQLVIGLWSIPPIPLKCHGITIACSNSWFLPRHRFLPVRNQWAIFNTLHAEDGQPALVLLLLDYVYWWMKYNIEYRWI